MLQLHVSLPMTQPINETIRVLTISQARQPLVCRLSRGSLAGLGAKICASKVCAQASYFIQLIPPDRDHASLPRDEYAAAMFRSVSPVIWLLSQFGHCKLNYYLQETL